MKTPVVFQPGSRRDFLKAAALGGAVVALPSLLTSCKLGDGVGTVTSGGQGNPLVFDFANGDTAILQFLYCFKQLQADMYAQIAAKFTAAGYSATEQSLYTDLRNHSLVHRDTLKAVLGASFDFTISPLWSGTNFSDKSGALTLAISFEDVSVGMYNGCVQRFVAAKPVALALEIVTVEARHSSALRNLDLPNSGSFAPTSQDPAYPLSSVAGAIQPYLNDRLQFVNAPTGI
jgi:TAT (twin-arginine translocation) pathway signal sequence.